jgi:hypothetical protein
MRISTFQIPDFKDMAMRLIGGFETTSSLLKKKLIKNQTECLNFRHSAPAIASRSGEAGGLGILDHFRHFSLVSILKRLVMHPDVIKLMQIPLRGNKALGQKMKVLKPVMIGLLRRR